MRKIIKYLNTLNPVLTGAQYAVGGDWEQANKIDLDDPIATTADDIDSSVAVEIFYKLNDDRMVFVGVRYSDKMASSPKQFLSVVLKSITYAKTGINDFLEHIGTNLYEDSLAYVSSSVDYVELGVEGFWKSEGSVVLRNANEHEISKDSLRQILQNHPNLTASTKNHTAVEFAVTEPESWIGVQVSKEENGVYKTDVDTLLTLVNPI